MVNRSHDADTQVSRRRFLKAAAGVGFVVSTYASGRKVVAQTPSPVAGGNYSEAPALADQVKAGTLPAVADRLPKNPMIITPSEKSGKYGGTWRTALVGGADTAWLGRTVGYDGLLRWDITWQETVPNIAESYEVSADATQHTFTLRDGMRWSDGEPFTTDDIAFYVNDYFRNDELNTSLGDNPFTIEVKDKLTFTVTHENPAGLFLSQLCQDGGREWVRYPAHYLKQFHKTYNTTDLDKLVKDSGKADWVELFRTMGGGIPGTPYDAVWQNPDLPRVHAWKLVLPYGDTERVTFDRNPYYFKVDPDGQQLPYIDNVNFDVLQDNQVLLLKATNGEIDFHMRHINTDANKSVLADGQEKGGYHFVNTVRSSMNVVSLALNLTHKNPAYREVFQNKDFRIGVSHAINRQEIIDTVYVSQGEPWQLAPRKETPFYNETLAKQYTEYNLDKANEFLDKVLPDKDGDMRLLKDGSKLTIAVEVATGLDQAQVDTTNLIVGYLQAVGIDAQIKAEDRSLLYTRKESNDHDAVIWGGDGGLNDAIPDPRWYMPFSLESNFAVPWAIWYGKNSNALSQPEEPPAAVQEQMKIYDQLKASPDPEEQNSLMSQLLNAAVEQFYAIGIGLPGPGYGIAKNTMHNLPADGMADAYVFMTPAPANPQTFFYDE
ncbi:MAG: ABC transporter substrate-binding protein [Thermomicrobiales bacterium]